MEFLCFQLKYIRDVSLRNYFWNEINKISIRWNNVLIAMG